MLGASYHTLLDLLPTARPPHAMSTISPRSWINSIADMLWLEHHRNMNQWDVMAGTPLDRHNDRDMAQPPLLS